MRRYAWSRYDNEIAVSIEEIELFLRGHASVAWSDFLLNPRRLRGSDFLMRWSQGVWSERRLIEAVNATEDYFALPYGPSSVAPDDPREHELYFERMEKAGLPNVKRPDLLIFTSNSRTEIMRKVEELGGSQQLPFISENEPQMMSLVRASLFAVECENSLWVANRMPEYGSELKPQKRLGGNLGLKKSAVVPTVIVKDEDRVPLMEWQQRSSTPIHIWHVFYDQAFGIQLDRIEALIESGLIQPTKQVFQAPGGPTTSKNIYKIYYHYAYSLATSTAEPQLEAASIVDKNGHILPYVKFEGGALRITEEALAVLDGAAKEKNK